MAQPTIELREIRHKKSPGGASGAVGWGDGSTTSGDNDLACHLGVKLAEVGVLAGVLEYELEFLVRIQHRRREFVLRAFDVVWHVISILPGNGSARLDLQRSGAEREIVNLDLGLT